MSRLTRYLRAFSSDIQYPVYTPKTGEDDFTKKKRLLYQSRKRGITENGIILSTFADKYLHKLNPEELNQYDKLINESNDDWSLYYWITGSESPPIEYQTPILDKIQHHARQQPCNDTQQQQPNLSQIK
jgi:succinate dehydrogenase assembly factor 2